MLIQLSIRRDFLGFSRFSPLAVRIFRLPIRPGLVVSNESIFSEQCNWKREETFWGKGEEQEDK